MKYKDVNDKFICFTNFNETKYLIFTCYIHKE